MLDTYPLAHIGVPGGGHVAGSVDPRGAGLEVLVHHDAVVEIEAGGGGELGPGFDPDAGDDEIGGENLALDGAHPLDGVVAHEGVDRGVGVELDAVVGVQVPANGADLGAEDALERRGHRVDEDDLDAELAGGGGHLRADPTGADHGQPTGRGQGGAEPVAVLHRSQVVDTVESDPGTFRRRGRAPVASSNRS